MAYEHQKSAFRILFLQLVLACLSESEAIKQRNTYLGLVMSKSTNRKRRHVSQKCGKDQATCCLSSIMVEVARDLDLHNVIAPRRFHSFYCHGSCSEKRNPYLSDKTCCVAVEYDSLKVTLVVNDEPKDYYLEKASAKRCACR